MKKYYDLSLTQNTISSNTDENLYNPTNYNNQDSSFTTYSLSSSVNIKNSSCTDSINCDFTCNSQNLYNCNFSKEEFTILFNESSEFTLDDFDCEIRLDLTAISTTGTLFLGEIKSSNSTSICNVPVTLLQPICIKGDEEYIPLDSTITDPYGFYQFFIPNLTLLSNYRIILGHSPLN